MQYINGREISRIGLRRLCGTKVAVQGPVVAGEEETDLG
jgi:hypothetical protein